MFVKILDPNLKIEFQELKIDNRIQPEMILQRDVYEVDSEMGKRLINANFAVEVTPQEMEKMKHES